MTTHQHTKYIHIRDAGVDLAISFEDCIKYHGRDSIGGLALGFKLLQWGLKQISPSEPIERSSIIFRTAFPGPGVRDAVELITRAYTNHRYEILENAPVGSPEGVYGFLYFEIQVNDKCLGVHVKPGVVSSDFIETGRATKKAHVSEQTLYHWKELKENLAQAVMAVNIEEILVIKKLNF